jgi:hypothetical protein
MASFNFMERRNLELYLQMGSGYVLNFSNRTFQEFVFDAVGLDIEDEAVGGYGSKASRLRHFMKHQSDHVVGKLLRALVDYRESAYDVPEPILATNCRQTADRLLQSAPIQDAEVISILSMREEFETLAKEILDCINKNAPESGLDRLPSP